MPLGIFIEGWHLQPETEPYPSVTISPAYYQTILDVAGYEHLAVFQGSFSNEEVSEVLRDFIWVANSSKALKHSSQFTFLSHLPARDFDYLRQKLFELIYLFKFASMKGEGIYWV